MLNAEWFSMILGICLFCKKEFKKREKKYKFCSLICSNKFNKNGLIKIEVPPLSPMLAEFIGICLGDGHISQYQTAITLNAHADIAYVPYVANIMRLLFPKVTISLIKKTPDNAIDVRLSSKLVSRFLLEMGLVPNHKKIPSWIFTRKDFQFACIRGLFDTEGSISFKLYENKSGISLYKQLNFRNTDMKLMRFVRDTLISIGLKPTMTLQKSLYLSNHQAINTFKQCIGFSNPKLITRSEIRTIDDYRNWKMNTTPI
jgi:hypothetical protein